MKTIKTIAFLVLSLLFGNVQAQNWSKGKIEGKGDVVKKEIQVDNFKGVSLGFSGDIILTQGSSQKVVVEAQQNIIDNIKREVKDGTWRVNFKQNVRNAKPVKVYITMPTLDYAAVSGSGDLRTDGRFSNIGDLTLRVSGSGDVNVDVDAKAVKTSISGSGGISVKGNASSNEIRISGSGDIYASDFRVNDCTIAISGSGNCKVHVNGSLDVKISGSGDVKYAGDCNVKSRISGSGDVKSM